MPDTALGSREAGAKRTDKVLPAWRSQPRETHNKQKNSIYKQNSIMKDTTNKIKFSDVIETDEWRRQIQNFM